MRCLALISILGCEATDIIPGDLHPHPVREQPVAAYEIPKVEPLPTVSWRPKTEWSIARCCGTEPATLGPLFEGADFGRVSYDWMDRVPESLWFEKLGVAISRTANADLAGCYLERIEIAVRDDDLCDDFEIHVEKLWGRGRAWRNPRRGQRAYFVRDGRVCSLSIFRERPHPLVYAPTALQLEALSGRAEW